MKKLGTYRYRQIERMVGPFVMRCLKKNHPQEMRSFHCNRDTIRKILIIRPSASVGDMVFLVPILRNIRAYFPSASLCMYSAHALKEFLSRCPYIDTVFAYDFIDNLCACAKHKDFIKRLTQESFDLVLDFESYYYYTAVFVHQINPKISVGFKYKDLIRHTIYDIAVEYQGTLHEVVNFSNIVKAIQVPLDDLHGELWIDEKARMRALHTLADNQLSSKKKIVALHPGAGRIEKMWPVEYYVALGNWLVATYGVQVIITGVPQEKEIGASLARGIHGAINCIGMFSLTEFIAIMSKFSLMVTNDTGALHIASVLKVPTIGLYGPTDSQRWRPLGKETVILASNAPCSPCVRMTGFEYQCKKRTCMYALSVDRVKTAITDMWATT